MGTVTDYSDIKKLIDNDKSSKKKQRAKEGQLYYEGVHDIRKYRLFYYNTDGQLVEDTTRSNIKIAHPFFTELADQLTSFILSNTDDVIHSDAEGLQEYLDEYFDDEFWSEMADLLTGSYTKGFDYLYAYQKNVDDQENRLHFQYADCIGVVEDKEKNTDANCKRFIYWYVEHLAKDNKEVIKIQVHTEKQILFLEQDGKSGKIEIDKDQTINPRPNVLFTNEETGEKYWDGKGLGFIPFFRLDYNKKQISGLKPIKGLIDDYDLMECGLSNNLQDFDYPIYAVKGYEGDDLGQLQQNLKTKKTVAMDVDGGVDVLTVDIPYNARKTKADEDEKNIYRFGMGLNTQGLKDTSATTNLAIQMAYALLELKANKFIKRIKKFLKPIIKIVIDEINTQNGTGYKPTDVKVSFKPVTLVNEQENIQNEKTKAETEQIRINTILNVAVQIGDEEVLRAICDILDIDFDKIKDNVLVNDGFTDAQTKLEGVVPTDEITGGGNTTEVKEEAEEEIGKSLNGAQTQSLINIIQQWKNGILTEQQAVNIISISIGISESKAKKLLSIDSA